MIIMTGEFFELIIQEFTHREEMDDIALIATHGFIMLILSVVLLLIAVFDDKLRRRKRTEDKIIFWEFMLVIIKNAVGIMIDVAFLSPADASLAVFYILDCISEMLFMLTILQWLIFVDYTLYRSPDHIRRRYRHAALPIFIVVAIKVLVLGTLYLSGLATELMSTTMMNALYWCVFAIELFYIIMALILERRYSREYKVPDFLRFWTFLIPFAAVIFSKTYDELLLTLGILVAYGTMKRRDRYLDKDTGFYNPEYLDYFSRYRDRKKYGGGTAILIDAAGHGKDMAKLIDEIRPSQYTVFATGKDGFLLMSETIRQSASQMIERNVIEEAQCLDEPFTPKVTVFNCKKDESAKDFASRIIGEGKI